MDGLLVAIALFISLQTEATTFILDQVECENPEEVAKLVFGEDSEDIFKDNEVPCSFEIFDLGDGTKSYVFSPPGGNGLWAVRPNYHFIKENNKLRLLFDGGGASTSYEENGPKYNGRYLISRTRMAELPNFTKGEPESIALVDETYFWNGARYEHAYTVTRADQNDSGELTAVRTWEEHSRQEFLAAHVTWTHRVDRYDTLTSICRQYSTSLKDVAAQNGIEDPDLILEGQTIMYDSKSQINY